VADTRPSIPQRIDAVKARVALSALIGRVVAMRQRGREWSGLCPFHQEKSPSFTVNDEKGFYHCFGCGAHGSVIDFVMNHEGLEFMPALERLEGDAGLAAESATRRESTKRAPDRQLVDGGRAAAEVWAMGKPAHGTLAERWFESRGIDPLASGVLDVVRFHPACPAALWPRDGAPRQARRHAPALIAPILRVRGERDERTLALRGVHLTFLAEDGRGKAAFEPWRDRRTGELQRAPTRVMWGSAARGAVLMPARPLRRGADVTAKLVELLAGAGALIVGEGLESTLSLLARYPEARLGCATLSLGNLEGVPRRDGPRDSLRLWAVQGDDARAQPFTFAMPGRVVVGVDADMKPTQPAWVQERKGVLAVKRGLTGLERAHLCGQLAAWHWRGAGATRVDVVRPPLGHDFNDLDRERNAA
jgi:hypothetical protein